MEMPMEKICSGLHRVYSTVKVVAVANTDAENRQDCGYHKALSI